jgi:hypothetical protein
MKSTTPGEEKFIETWNQSDGVDAVALAMGMEYVPVVRMATRLRARGVALKKYQTGAKPWRPTTGQVNGVKAD